MDANLFGGKKRYYRKQTGDNCGTDSAWPGVWRDP